MLDAVTAWLRGLLQVLPWFRTPTQEALPLPPPPAEPEPAPELPPLMPAPKPRRKRITEDGGTFWYFDDLLEQLPACRKLMRKMRKIDPEAYAYNARMGARVMPNFMWDTLEVPAAFLKKLPAQGMVFTPPTADALEATNKNRYDGVFTYFQKIQQNIHMVVPKDDVAAIYRCSSVYVRYDKKVATGAEFAVALINGLPRLIAERCMERAGPGFYRERWGYPAELEWWHTRGKAETLKAGGRTAELSPVFFGDTVEDFAACLFGQAAKQYTESAAEHFQVRAERDHVSIGFSVGLGRTPYFFKDRERVVNINGKTRRIFHHVDAHARKLANGKVSQVREHYRGLRRFTWKGEHIVVTAPDWSPFTIDVTAQEFKADEMPSMDKYVTQAEAGEKLRDFIEAEPAQRSGRGIDLVR